MTTHPKLPAPQFHTLGEAGMRLCRATLRDYRLAPHERFMLEHICAETDTVAALEAAIARDGAVIRGSKGQPIIHRAIKARDKWAAYN
jgi:hypothetical protein